MGVGNTEAQRRGERGVGVGGVGGPTVLGRVEL